MSNIEHPKLPGISVVIPAYRTPGSIDQLCAELERYLDPLAHDFELIFVDDGSPDDTWQRISGVADHNQRVQGIRLLRNYGQHNALLAGLRSARYPIILTMDDDLQNPPCEIPRMLAALTDDIDLVYGSPAKEAQSACRNIASVITKRLLGLFLGPDVNSQMSAFRVFRQELLRGSSLANDPHVSIDVLLSWATTRAAVINVAFDRREEGASGYTVRKLIRHTINMVTGYSTRPLRAVSGLGFLISSFGFALFAYVLVQFVMGESEVAGFTFVAAAISLFSGVQLLSLGIVGEYLARMHFRTMGRPAYAIRSTTETPTSATS